jgi:transcriptional regulator with XRE-family HTH domain
MLDLFVIKYYKKPGELQMYDLGSRLKATRLQRGLTQKELAARVSKSVSAISSYESNAQLPPLDVLESIALTLHVSIDYLVGLDNFYTYSTRNLTEKQKDLVDALFCEFSHHSEKSDTLTNHQIHLIYKLFLTFRE